MSRSSSLLAYVTSIERNSKERNVSYEKNPSSHPAPILSRRDPTTYSFHVQSGFGCLKEKAPAPWCRVHPRPWCISCYHLAASPLYSSLLSLLSHRCSGLRLKLVQEGIRFRLALTGRLKKTQKQLPDVSNAASIYRNICVGREPLLGTWVIEDTRKPEILS